MNDFIRIRRVGQPQIQFQWHGPWPPPEHVLIATFDGREALVQATEDEATLHRVMASELPDDMDYTYLARGALYVEDLEAWDGRS